MNVAMWEHCALYIMISYFM